MHVLPCKSEAYYSGNAQHDGDDHTGDIQQNPEEVEAALADVNMIQIPGQVMLLAQMSYLLHKYIELKKSPSTWFKKQSWSKYCPGLSTTPIASETSSRKNKKRKRKMKKDEMSSKESTVELIIDDDSNLNKGMTICSQLMKSVLCRQKSERLNLVQIR